MRIAIALIVACAALGGCAGHDKFETLAKCSADESPVPSSAYVSEEKGQQPKPLSERLWQMIVVR